MVANNLHSCCVEAKSVHVDIQNRTCGAGDFMHLLELAHTQSKGAPVVSLLSPHLIVISNFCHFQMKRWIGLEVFDTHFIISSIS